LLHDIGKLITNQFLTGQSSVTVRSLISRGQLPIEAEKNVLGTDHAEVGAALAYVWRLPDFLVEAIALHHTPPVASCASTLAYFADKAAHEADRFEQAREGSVREAELKIFRAMGYSLDSMQSLVGQVLDASAATEECVAVA
jgi:HD-like signal output (HDOD) protein